jgi:hypothetical protein
MQRPVVSSVMLQFAVVVVVDVVTVVIVDVWIGTEDCTDGIDCGSDDVLIVGDITDVP